MNIERAYTVLAGLLLVTIIGAYAFGLEKALFDHTLQRTPTIIYAAAQSAVGPAEHQLADRQALAEFQTTLPLFAPDANSTPRQIAAPFEQITDRQTLAEFQAMLPFYASVAP